MNFFVSEQFVLVLINFLIGNVFIVIGAVQFFKLVFLYQGKDDSFPAIFHLVLGVIFVLAGICAVKAVEIQQWLSNLLFGSFDIVVLEIGLWMFTISLIVLEIYYEIRNHLSRKEN